MVHVSSEPPYSEGTCTIYFCNWGLPLIIWGSPHKSCGGPHIISGAPHIIIWGHPVNYVGPNIITGGPQLYGLQINNWGPPFVNCYQTIKKIYFICAFRATAIRGIPRHAPADGTGLLWCGIFARKKTTTKIHLNLICHRISFVDNLLLSRQIVLKFCTEHALRKNSKRNLDNCSGWDE